jgi:hypothetical protein
VRLLFFQLWKVLLAALLALILARVDEYVERRYPDSGAGKAWRAYRGKRKKKPPTQAHGKP